MIHILSRPVITSSYHQYYNVKLSIELVIVLVVFLCVGALILIIDRLRNDNTEDDNRENDE